MNGSHLVKEARRAAGLTQAQLAEKVGTTQSAIARIESGRHAPSLQRLSDIAMACGYDIQVRLVPHDDHDWTLVSERRKHSFDKKVDDLVHAVEVIQEGRRAMSTAKAEVAAR